MEEMDTLSSISRSTCVRYIKIHPNGHEELSSIMLILTPEEENNENIITAKIINNIGTKFPIKFMCTI